MEQVAKFLIGMCLLFGGSQSAIAHLNYGSLALNPSSPTNDCYSYLTHTVPTSPTLLGAGQEIVGLMCFTHVTTAAGTVTDSHVVNTNSTVALCNATGTYGFATPNKTYFGGGWIKFPTACFKTIWDISVNEFGFQLLKTAGDATALVDGGTAFYQGPQSSTYISTILNGCYSFLSETVLKSPTPTGPGKDLMGTICFAPTSGSSATLSYGYTRNLAGVIHPFNNPPCAACVGNYTVAPNGTGTMCLGSATCTNTTNLAFAFATFDVNGGGPGVAGGFQFVLIHPGSTSGAKIEGGTAYFQQP